MAQLGDAQLDTGGRPSWGCDSQRQLWCQQSEIVVSKVLGGARKVSSRAQTLAGPSGDHTRQAVPCHPWEPHETAPPRPAPHHPQHLPCPPAGQRSPLLCRQQPSSPPHSWPRRLGRFRETPACGRENTSCSGCDLQAAPQMAKEVFFRLNENE